MMKPFSFPPFLSTEINEDSSAPSPINTRRVGVHLYFYSEVTDTSCMGLACDLQQMASDHINQAWDESDIRPIWLHVHSPGGSAFAALGIADTIKSLRVPVYSVIEGYCASGATLLVMSAKKRFIRPNALVMIHQLRGVMWGTYQQLQDQMIMNDMIMQKLMRFYMEHSHLDEAKVRELLSRDSWLDAEECLKYGIVDQVVRPHGAARKVSEA